LRQSPCAQPQAGVSALWLIPYQQSLLGLLRLLTVRLMHRSRGLSVLFLLEGDPK